MGDVRPSHIRKVTAVVGPTNTGKTHLAIERMLDHETGIMGLPLRLLAREVYDKLIKKAGIDNVALITGEEKIKPRTPRYWVCTVEAMPLDVSAQFVAIDEIQLASDPERGHVFTDRLLNFRGSAQTLILGSGTMRGVIDQLITGAHFISRPRLSKLTYAGQKKITRLPERSAIIAFSANQVYAVAELIRRQRGGAAVVLGALSPRTRNAQVELFQSGDVDFLVATDAIGMGLNLDVNHVAFSAICKFDGQNHRNLNACEIAQIAGRAGRHLSDGTFGVTGDMEPFESNLIEQIETHQFDPIRTLQWRNTALDFSSVEGLLYSLRLCPDKKYLTRARMADDVKALENLSHNHKLLDRSTSNDIIEKLWDVCQIPDYRKISSQNHADLIGTLFNYIIEGSGQICHDWLEKQIEYSDRMDGDIDTLSNRLAHIRTWKFVANRSDWLSDPEYWQERTRQIEDNLSDALHSRLMQRFVDERTSALMKGLKDKDRLSVYISDDGQIKIEDHFVGRLVGFCFKPDSCADGIHGKATRHAATRVLSREMSIRARRVIASTSDAFELTLQGKVLYQNNAIAKLLASDDLFKPQVKLIADEYLQGLDRDRVLERVNSWVRDVIAERLKPLIDISKSKDVTGLAKGIAFRLTENFGVLRRETATDEIKALDQSARAQLRRFGLRFGAFNLFFPLLLKPAAAEILLILWFIKFGKDYGLDTENLPEPPRAGLTSVPVNATTPDIFYKVCGFHSCGPRAVRVDILERLADQIRPLLSWKPSEVRPIPPKGATGAGAFIITSDMMSILGCSIDELKEVLLALGFRQERKLVRKCTDPNLWKYMINAQANEKQKKRAHTETINSKHDDNIILTNYLEIKSGSLKESKKFNFNIPNDKAQPKDTDNYNSITINKLASVESLPNKEAVNVKQNASNIDITGDVTDVETPENCRTNFDASIDNEEIFIETWRPRRRNDTNKGHSQQKKKILNNINRINESNTKQSSGYLKNDVIVNLERINLNENNNRDKPNLKLDRSEKHRYKTNHNGRKKENKNNIKPSRHPSSHNKESRLIDPDSPFAALNVLRNTLNNQGDRS
ncbi:MAG: hypothetical protein TECD_00308 [Hyphomicrobiaceae bacterium hypho_1]